MTKILRVGDPHVMVSNLKESQALIDYVIELAKKEGCETIEFLGDLFHTHAVMRVEVVDFWLKNFQKIEMEQLECRVLVGNHDQPGSKEKEQIMNALNIFDSFGDEDSLRTIINEPMIIDNIAYIPYMSDKSAFLKASAELYDKGATKLLVAHQTFTGAKYDNGFFAEDGIEPDLVSQDNIVSGHIHKAQQIGKCEYPGTAKWDTMSDANQNKGLTVFTHNKDGSIADRKFFSTADIVTPIYKIQFVEGDEEPVLSESARNYVELVGKTAWITKMKKKFKGKANIKARPTDRKVVKIESEDLITIQGYVKEHFDIIDGVDRKDVNKYLESLNG